MKRNIDYKHGYAAGRKDLAHGDRPTTSLVCAEVSTDWRLGYSVAYNVRLKTGLKADDPILGAEVNPEYWIEHMEKDGVHFQCSSCRRSESRCTCEYCAECRTYHAKPTWPNCTRRS